MVSYSGSLVRFVIEELHSRSKHTRCEEIGRYLMLLGFEVREGKRGGHRVYVHRGIRGFLSSSYDCGHGTNPIVKPVYVRKIVQVLRQYEPEIRLFLENQP